MNYISSAGQMSDLLNSARTAHEHTFPVRWEPAILFSILNNETQNIINSLIFNLIYLRDS